MRKIYLEDLEELDSKKLYDYYLDVINNDSIYKHKEIVSELGGCRR